MWASKEILCKYQGFEQHNMYDSRSFCMNSLNSDYIKQHPTYVSFGYLNLKEMDDILKEVDFKTPPTFYSYGLGKQEQKQEAM